MRPEKRKLKKGAKKRLFRRFTTIMLSTFVAGTVASVDRKSVVWERV